MRTLFVIALLVLLCAFSSLISATTLTVNVSRNYKQAQIVLASNSQLVFTYPENSPTSFVLRSLNYSVAFSVANVPHDSEVFQRFQAYLRSAYSNITLENLSVSFSLHALGNSTELVVSKSVVFSGYATGIFNRTRQTIIGNFAWKSFVIKGPLEIDFEDERFDINSANFMLMAPLLHKGITQFLPLEDLQGTSTINLSSLNTPISEWKRTYDPSTNTTTFSKSVQSVTALNLSLSVNGNVYALRLTYDPSAEISVPGYAIAQGNEIVITKPQSMIDLDLSASIAIALVLIGIGALLYLRRMR
ncbi:hypothetical protein B9Q01_08510 [Candidatus Marsarchaeota G1 archaeon OSP_D]|uniref:Uncharacterized protein n=2 Tax=Candidatus Marsarchaeota group 1 TaxID=2203770 RepID=A0A2R6A7A6_9ARCH|nr:MAG: hypothetical protein B9Q01_08510 [Candidatus Marsarchaeota G1 archaeon OSP_D]PSN87158.1 MAG: hypothetical protein B9Q00_09625 [Candidatus Marsarchaeota G1 archaeon OSP_C]